MKFRSHTLDNGLEIVAECNDAAHSMGVGFFVRAGSRDETDEVAGVSHFLEHMAFKGTQRRTADDVNREFDQIGAQNNAYTSEESTVYYASVLPEYQAPCVDILADIMRPSLRQEDFQMEKKVILEEIQMYADQPPYGMDDHLKELHYGAHPLSRSVLGTVETIEALRVEQMREYFQRRYSPGNLFVAAAGRVDFEALIKQVEAACAGWAAEQASRETSRPTTSASSDSFAPKCVFREGTAQQYVLQLADGPAAEDGDRFAAKLMATIVGDDSGSRMYWDLIDNGYAESASLGHYEYQGAGMLFTWMSCAPEDAAANCRRMREIQELAQRDGFTGEELRQAQSKVKSRVVLGSERPRSRLFNVGGNWMHRKEYRSIEQDLASISAVTLDELHQVLEKYPLTRATTLTVGPLEQFTVA